jgi:hypothetical protein
MNPSFCKSIGCRLLIGTIVTVLLSIPLESGAQRNNTAYGYATLFDNTTGSYNTAFGFDALGFNTTGFSNTANGAFALYDNLTGYGNTANGTDALKSNTTGYDNTATGFDALFLNTTGYYNTANGSGALNQNTTGYSNTADGAYALLFNTTGFNNTANGFNALAVNTTGYDNTANGAFALYDNLGNYNTADGANSLHFNTTGFDNTANGYAVLYTNTTGYSNAASGFKALFFNTTGFDNTAYGVGALYSNTIGGGNIALGNGAGANITTGNNNIAIGNAGLSTDSGVIRLGTVGIQRAAFIAGIHGVTSSAGVEVFINSSGQLGTITSSRRFKDDIRDMGSASEKLMKLRPVTFRYKQADENGIHPLQYGLIAEEVAKVYPDLVQYDKAGKPFTVYYHLLTPMLLNELQKAHRQTESQKSEISNQGRQIALLRRENADLKSELVSLTQTQRQQARILAKLTAFAQASQQTHPASYGLH